MGEGFYGVSDEFIMYVVAPVLVLVVVFPLVMRILFWYQEPMV